MTQAGWYPDPGGQQGRYRYWDGRAWSASTTTNPGAPPPPGASTPQASSGQGQPAQSAYARYQQTSKRKGRAGWWIGGGVLVLIVIVVAVFAIRAISNSNVLTGGPGGQGSEDVCPTNPYASESPTAQPNDGRVHGGQMSYPLLPAPWGAPEPDYRVPFGRGVQSQEVMVEPEYDGRSSWVASVLIAELVAGDGFFSPEEGSKIVTKCIVGSFYGDGTEVTRDDKVNKATKVDGKDAWLVESHLSFDIPKLKTKGELMIVLIVATSASASSIFYASIPDTTPQLVQPAKDVMKQLTVSS